MIIIAASPWETRTFVAGGLDCCGSSNSGVTLPAGMTAAIVRPGAAWSPTDRAACPQEGQQKYILGLVGTIARNRSSVVRGWPCGQDSHPKSECHLRRDLRHEAGGVGYWF